MAGSRYFPAVGPSYHLADRKAGVQSAINCYPQRTIGDAWTMQGIPGEVQIAALGAPIRNRRDVEGRWLLVAGATLYEMAPDGTATARGTLLTNTGFVGMAHNRAQLVLVDGGNLYVFTLATNVMTQITSAGWRGSNDVYELDGYMIFCAPDTDQFYISAIDDSAVLDALDFSSADSQPDDIVAHRVSHRQAWFFGTRSTELWINSGATAFPFERYNSYTLDVGIVGPRAAINAADTLFWVGQTQTGRGLVYMAAGNQPQRVSTRALEEALAGSSDLSAATMWAYQVEGHEFIGIDAPGLSTTWVYDASTQQWHERGEWSDGWQPLRGRLHLSFGGQVYAGDDDGKVTRLSSSTSTLNNRTLMRERTWPHLISPGMEPVSYHAVELALATGSGTGVVTLEISNDGGYTFGPPLQRSLGAVGRWMQRVRWLGLGTAINRVFRIRCSDAAPFALHAATVEAS